MSIATEISRLQTAKADIKTSLVAKGVPIGSELISEYADILDSTPIGDNSENLDATKPIVRWIYRDTRTGRYRVWHSNVEIGATATPPAFVGDTTEYGTIDTTGSYTNMAYVPALEFKGWNHTTAQLGNTQFDFDVGAKYETADGKLYALIYGDSVPIYVIATAENPVTIDYGDGTVTTYTEEVDASHTYASVGYWWVKITKSGESYADGAGSNVIKFYATQAGYSIVSWALSPNGFQIDGFALNTGKQLDFYVNEDSGYYSTIVGQVNTGSIPKGVNIFSTSPDTLVSGGIAIYNGLRRVRKMTVNIGDDSGTNSIGQGSFVNLSSLRLMSFTQANPPILSSSTMWTGFPATTLIAVPTASYSAYYSATNYSAIQSQLITYADALKLPLEVRI